ncbi:hypothetical protein KUTeg_023342 [Tegillarca granosa]|uniref:Uncharacterized protein n=1 Tax=Tegillarca granosa TaxID=220873 RepID=A0ABQ9E5X6_TEGGR|nr:hypothetical protein KUTeg_023342 [Tegillarca granosa]
MTDKSGKFSQHLQDGNTVTNVCNIGLNFVDEVSCLKTHFVVIMTCSGDKILKCAPHYIYSLCTGVLSKNFSIKSSTVIYQYTDRGGFHYYNLGIIIKNLQQLLYWEEKQGNLVTFLKHTNHSLFLKSIAVVIVKMISEKSLQFCPISAKGPIDIPLIYKTAVNGTKMTSNSFDALLDFGESTPADNGTIQQNSSDAFDPFGPSPTIDVKGNTGGGDLLVDFGFGTQQILHITDVIDKVGVRGDSLVVKTEMKNSCLFHCKLDTKIGYFGLKQLYYSQLAFIKSTGLYDLLYREIESVNDIPEKNEIESLKHRPLNSFQDRPCTIPCEILSKCMFIEA